jgi:Transposase domain (DUF772)
MKRRFIGNEIVSTWAGTRNSSNAHHESLFESDCEEVNLKLAYRWLSRLGLDDPVPDHSSFSKTRHGRLRDGELLRHLFKNSVRLCMSEGLVKVEGFAEDASLVKTDVSRQTAIPDNELSTVNWREPKRCARAVKEYLDGVDQENPIETVPKSISLTDPCACWTAADGPAFFSDSTNYLIDLHAGVIVEVQICGSTLRTNATPLR